MPIRPPRPGQVASVKTVAPRTLGFPVVQLSLPVARTVSNETTIEEGASEWPLARFASWDWLSFFDRANAPTLEYRSADAYFACLCAAQSYLPLGPTNAIVRKLLPGVTVERLSNVGPDRKSYDVYTGDGYILIAIPGTQSLRELLREVGITLASYPNLPVNWWLWRGFFDTATAYNTEFNAVFAEELSKPDRRVIFTGHSLGAVLAAWFSFFWNYKSTFEGRGAKPVIACYSYACPAGWVDTKRTQKFTSFHRHYRVVNPGDPVPDMIQTGSLNLPKEPTIVKGDYTVCQHYDSLLAPVNPAVNFLPFGDALGKAVWQLLFTDVKSIVNTLNLHNFSEYLRGLSKQCINKGDTPVKTFDLMEQWTAKLLGQGFDIWADSSFSVNP